MTVFAPVFDPNRPVGFESRKSYAHRCTSGFWEKFITGPNVLDIGYRGGFHNSVPICAGAVGIELDHFYIEGAPVTADYDGLRLPMAASGSVDAVHSSHVLEHVQDDAASLREWWRVLRVGGHLITFVPHAYLYERRLTVPPSQWSGEHLRCYTPASLLALVERVFSPNTYRIRHFQDNDRGYDYSLSLEEQEL